jgi:CubicO group peptidase (beta-lactamase class C family)
MRADSRIAVALRARFDDAMDDVAALCKPGALQQLLERHAAAAPCAHVDVAFVCGTAVATASIGSGRAAPIGCLAKLLTATLIASAIERGELDVDSQVGPQLDGGGEAVCGVTVRHLLEHTHGLDDSLLAAPRHERGFVDRAELLRRVARLERWASPGAAYSYGNLGAWLLGALLERLRDRPFAALVHDELLAPLGAALCGEAVCAATGAGLRLTAAQLARFGLRALAERAPIAAAPITPLPGWHPLERGICRGWKAAGSGWFGHQSVWPGAASYLRAHAQRELALAVVARDQAASLVALALFGRVFPELFEGRHRVPAARAPGADAAFGVYAQAARVIAISSTEHTLIADGWERDEHGAAKTPAAQASLVALGDVLLARPATELMPYLQRVAGEQGADWLWNGRFVLRRID